MRIVVAGGTGFIGSEVVRRLLEGGEGDEVVVTSREPGGADPWNGRVQRVQAFAGDALSLARAFTRADVVVHCIQFPNHPVEDASKGRTYMEVDGHGTSVAAAAAKRVGVRRFVYLSGAGAGQDRPQPWFRAKDIAERAIRESGLEHGILRPSWIYGPRDHSMNRFVFFCRRLPFVPVIGNGRTPVNPIHVDDVARRVVELVRRPDATDKVFEIGGARLTMDEVIRTIQDVLRRRRPLVHHPVGLMKLLALPMTLLPEPVLSPGAVEFIAQEVEIDPGPADAYFGGPPRPLAEGLREYIV
jgi:NADH dehydrogenase